MGFSRRSRAVLTLTLGAPCWAEESGFGLRAHGVVVLVYPQGTDYTGWPADLTGLGAGGGGAAARPPRREHCLRCRLRREWCGVLVLFAHPCAQTAASLSGLWGLGQRSSLGASDETYWWGEEGKSESAFPVRMEDSASLLPPPFPGSLKQQRPSLCGAGGSSFCRGEGTRAAGTSPSFRPLLTPHQWVMAASLFHFWLLALISLFHTWWTTPPTSAELLAPPNSPFSSDNWDISITVISSVLWAWPCASQWESKVLHHSFSPKYSFQINILFCMSKFSVKLE